MVDIQPPQLTEDFRQLVDNAPLLVSRHSKDGKFIYASPSYRQLLGYEPDELRDQSLYLFIHPAEVERLRSACAMIQSRKEPRTVACRMKHKDGHFMWVDITCNVSADSQSIQIFGVDNSTTKYLEEALRIMARGTDTLHGLDYFRVLISQVAAAMRMPFAFITEHVENKTKVRMLAFWQGKDFGTPFEYGLAGTPCDAVINEGRQCYYPTGIQALFPHDKDLVSLAAQGYIGVPIVNGQEEVIGHLAVLDNKQMMIEDREFSILRIFAGRASVELERWQREQQRGAAAN
ncbi:MAG: PAS domain-containing protein [Anaerolineae bacterium]